MRERENFEHVADRSTPFKYKAGAVIAAAGLVVYLGANKVFSEDPASLSQNNEPAATSPVSPGTTERSPTPTVEPSPEENPLYPEVDRGEIEEWEFQGALQYNRNGECVANVDCNLTWRVNSAGFVENSSGNYELTGNPILNYGVVVEHLSDSQYYGLNYIGSPGTTTVASLHNITSADPDNTRVEINGQEYATPRYIQPEHNRLLGPNAPKESFEMGYAEGDDITMYLNNEDGTISELTYEVRRVYVISPEDVDALYDPPKNQNVSLLRIYSCWPDYTAWQRQVGEAVLVSHEIYDGQIPSPGNQPLDLESHPL